MDDLHQCLFCGQPIEPTELDPCSALMTMAASVAGADAARQGRRRADRWWQRPPEQFWMHAACLRQHAHSTIPLHFLDVADPSPG